MKKKVITNFSQEVYQATALIPPGHVSTYSAIALFLGRPHACRAVGQALHHNPFAPKVPCHRVVKSDGQVGGFAGGRRRKEALLRQEGVRCRNGYLLDWPEQLFYFDIAS